MPIIAERWNTDRKENFPLFLSLLDFLLEGLILLVLLLVGFICLPRQRMVSSFASFAWWEGKLYTIRWGCKNSLFVFWQRWALRRESFCRSLLAIWLLVLSLAWQFGCVLLVDVSILQILKTQISSAFIY